MTYQEKVKTARYIVSVFKNFNSDAQPPEKSSDISWSWVYGMAKKHSLAGIVFSALEPKIKAEAPVELYLDWSRDNAVLCAKHLAQKSEFQSIVSLFTENRISFLPLKGFLIKELYKSPELREMTDLDIYIGEADFKKASDLLVSAGYAPDKQYEVHDCFIKRPFIEIELHKILHLDISDYSIENAVPKADNPYWYIMNEEDFIIFLLHHAKKHDTAGGAGIRTIFDFYLLFEKGKERIDFASLEARIEREELGEFYKKLRALIDFWFYGGRLDDALLEFEVYTVTGGTYGNLENAFLTQENEKGKSIALNRVFPPYKLMSSRYPVLKKCPPLLPFFYIWRVFVSIFNGAIVRNVKALRGAKKNKKQIEEYKKSENEKLE